MIDPQTPFDTNGAENVPWHDDPPVNGCAPYVVIIPIVALFWIALGVIAL